MIGVRTPHVAVLARQPDGALLVYGSNDGGWTPPHTPLGDRSVMGAACALLLGLGLEPSVVHDTRVYSVGPHHIYLWTCAPLAAGGSAPLNARSVREGESIDVPAFSGLRRLGLNPFRMGPVELAAHEDSPPTIDAILASAASLYGLTGDSLRTMVRDRPHSDARAIAAYLLREQLAMSSPEIGGVLGHRTHSTVQAMWRRVEKSLEVGDDISARVARARTGSIGRVNSRRRKNGLNTGKVV